MSPFWHLDFEVASRFLENLCTHATAIDADMLVSLESIERWADSLNLLVCCMSHKICDQSDCFSIIVSIMSVK
jgi:hypothetical protein